MEAKRSLGQNFFVNENLGKYILNQLKDCVVDTVVEIGPGMGFFTKKLIEVFKNVYVVEKDTQISKNLEMDLPSITVFNQDFLEFELQNIPTKDIMFFGSLPFNISKKIIKKVVESEYFTNSAYFIVQKEVAQKYQYKKPYSSLSLKTQIYAKTKKIVDISPDSFKPRPKVTSSLISFTPTDLKLENKEQLKMLISLSFTHPRKNLYNNLKGSMYEKGSLLYKDKRPSQLSLDNYIEILNRCLF